MHELFNGHTTSNKEDGSACHPNKSTRENLSVSTFFREVPFIIGIEESPGDVATIVLGYFESLFLDILVKTLRKTKLLQQIVHYIIRSYSSKYGTTVEQTSRCLTFE